MRYLSMALRTAVCCFVALIGYIKLSGYPAQNGKSMRVLIDVLPTVQALYPLLMNAAFTFFIICDKFVCADADQPKLNHSAVYLVVAGLKAYPMLTYLLLRDQKQVAITISWAIRVLAHFIVAITSGSHQEMVTFMTYTLISGVILLDIHRQNRAVIDLISVLQSTIVETEETCAEVQASELCAMIGNPQVLI